MYKGIFQLIVLCNMRKCSLVNIRKSPHQNALMNLLTPPSLPLVPFLSQFRTKNELIDRDLGVYEMSSEGGRGPHLLLSCWGHCDIIIVGNVLVNVQSV